MLRGRGLYLSSLLALLAAPAAGAAEPPAAAATEPERVTRPTPLGALGVEYPAGASGRAKVVLELLVERDGAVAEVRVIAGAEPFAAEALRAARSFRFDPARRGAEPVPARIRVVVEFEPPAPLDAEPAPPEPAEPAQPSKPAPPRAAADSGGTIEILVLGDRPAAARTSLGRGEVRELPGTFGDPFRAIEVMPGVTPILTGVPFFFVRGAPPGNVGYFLDGVRVPLLYHVALGPSVIHPGLVDRVDLYSGGYPARYGRYAGGIVAAETTPPRAELHGEANARIFDAGALVEAPFASGRGVALVGGRYSYTAAILSLMAPEVSLTYWDYQARASYDLTPELRVGAFAFGAYDAFAGDEDDTELQTQFHRVDLRADLRPDARTHLRAAVTIGFDRSAGTDDEDTPGVEDRILGARLELEQRVAANAELRAGMDLMLDRFGVVDIDSVVDDDSGQAFELFFSRTDVAVGAFADVVWEPESWVRVTPGLRFDVYASGPNTVPALDPRIAAEFALGERVRLEHTFGVAHQPPSFLLPAPGFVITDLGDGLQQSLQSSAGLKLRPGAGFEAGVTLFHNTFFAMTDFLGASRVREQNTDPEDEDRLDSRSLGQAYGLELILRRGLTQRVGGYLAYTLSRSTRRAGFARQVASFDRTHVFHAALAYDLGRSWRSGARLSAYTGIPATRNEDFPEVPSPQPSARSPLFYRLDLRLEKRWHIGGEGRYWAFVVEMLNATLHKEVVDYECDPSGCSGEAIGPVSIPSIGVEVFF